MNNTNASGEVTTVNLGEQLQLLESLPAELRALVQHAPVQVDLRVIWAIWQRFGQDAQDQIEAVFNSEFPGWMDPPRPRGVKLAAMQSARAKLAGLGQ